MNKLPSQKLLQRYILGICSTQEEQKVEEWLKDDSANAQLLQELAEDPKAPILSDTEKNEIKKSLITKLEKRTGRNIVAKETNNNEKTSSGLISPIWFKAAAVILVAAVTAVVGFYYTEGDPQKDQLVWKELELPSGRTATINFSDGTSIKVNSGSSIRYPKQFDAQQREVYLQGEAFFSVAENKDKPFLVHAGSVQTRVLGTAFNVNAYETNEQVQVAVQEGRVALSADRDTSADRTDGSEVMLEKDEWILFDAQKGLQAKQKGNIWKKVAWKDRVLIFDDKPLSRVATMLERWYGVKVIIEDPQLNNVVLSGEHDDVSLQKVLNNIKFILNIKYTMEGDTVRIDSKGNE